MVIIAKIGNKTTTAPINIQGGTPVHNLLFFILFNMTLFIANPMPHLSALIHKYDDVFLIEFLSPGPDRSPILYTDNVMFVLI